MDYRNLGRSGLKVPLLSFGTGTFGIFWTGVIDWLRSFAARWAIRHGLNALSALTVAPAVFGGGWGWRCPARPGARSATGPTARRDGAARSSTLEAGGERLRERGTRTMGGGGGSGHLPTGGFYIEN